MQPATYDEESYRARKEASVSDLTGTTMMELVVVSTPIPMSMWLLAEVKALGVRQGHLKAVLAFGWRGFTLEVLVVLLPSLAAMVWPTCALTLLLSMAFASVCCRLAGRACSKAATSALRSSARPHGSRSSFPMTDFVTNFRASVMVMTCITILAVDFQVFPRRFAKTEVFGTGLMDLGVGATVFASGLASGCRAKRIRREDGLPVWRAVLADVTHSAVRAWPLAALGISRLAVIKGLGYQEHVSEYGVHWNFFATLFFLRLVVVPMNRLHPARLRLYLALAALCVYQWMLAAGGLSKFVVDAPRDTLFSMNREGVLGIVGFVAIHYIAEELGSQVWAHRQTMEKERKDALSSSRGLAITAGFSITLWGLALMSRGFIQPTSRRMVNLTYVLWVCAHSTLMLNLLMLVDSLSLSPPRSQILAAVNINMFPVFMVANLATGAINISMRTLDADSVTSLVILSIYVVLVAGFAVTLSNRNLLMKV